MSTNAIISTRNLDINRVSFVVGQAKNGRNASINIKYDGQNIGIRLPRLAFPGGVLSRTDDKTGAVGYSLMGSLKGADPYGKDRANDADESGKLYNFLLDLNEKIVQSATENSVKWFGKKRSEEAIRDGMKSLMRLSVDKVDGEYIPNGKYPPSLVLKVPVYDGRVNVDLAEEYMYKNNKGVDTIGIRDVYTTPQSLSTTIPKGVEANIAVSASIYVMAGGGFGVTWRVSHVLLPIRKVVTTSSIFADLLGNAEDDDVEEPSQSQAPAPSPAAVPEVPFEVPDLDEDAPAPAPAPQRKRRTATPAV